MDGSRELKYRFQVICNRCHARGKTVTTDWIRDSLTEYGPKDLGDYINEATNAWNTRVSTKP